jgi:hypothetical protein
LPVGAARLGEQATGGNLKVGIAFFDAGGIKPNLASGPREMLHAAAVIRCIDSTTENKLLVFGRDASKRRVCSGLDQETNDWEKLLWFRASKAGPNTSAGRGGDHMLVCLMFLSVPAYVIVQIVALFRMSGWWLLAGLLPIVPMAVVSIITHNAYGAQSNMWPILLLFASPAALIYLVILLLVNKRVNEWRVEYGVTAIHDRIRRTKRRKTRRGTRPHRLARFRRNRQ